MKKFLFVALVGTLAAVIGSCELFEDPFAGSLSVGDEGPAGGVVIFVDNDRDHDFDYIEVAPVDLGTGSTEYYWGLNVAVSGTGTGIGTGATNTTRIISVQEEETNTPTNYAAKAAEAFSYGGFENWHLPSKDELNLVHELRASIDGLRPNQYYWTSSDVDSNVTWVWSQIVNSDTGRQANAGSNGKTASRPVRVVRYFNESDL